MFALAAWMLAGESVFNTLRSELANAAVVATWLALSAGNTAAAASISQRPIAELEPLALIHVGKTADWVAVTPDAVWVGSTGPDAAHRIDPATNRRIATVKLPGEPCAGLATGFGSLWIPLCGKTASLAKVDLKSNRLMRVFNIGPAAAEGGVATSADSVWLVVSKDGSLARIDPDKGAVRQTIALPAGSYNPYYDRGRIWVTRADGAEVTAIDAATGAIVATLPTGPGPRFLSAGAGAIWTLNQGDGSVSRIDPDGKQPAQAIALNTPGHGGDIGFGGGMVWTTFAKVPLSVIDADKSTPLCQWIGPGGDSLGIGHGSIWLTDYHAGTIARIDLQDALARCNSAPNQ